MGRFGRYLCKISFCGQGCKKGVCGVREGGTETNSNSLGAVSRSRVDTELFPSLGSVEQCINAIPWEMAVNEYTGSDSSLPLYFVHVESWFTVSISLIAFDTLCHLPGTSVNHRSRAEENEDQVLGCHESHSLVVFSDDAVICTS